MAKGAGLRSQEAQAYEILGFIASHRNDPGAARNYFRESAGAYAEIGAAFNVVLEKSNLAHLERRLGNHAAALEFYRETIVTFREMGQTGAVAHQLECFGFIALARGESERSLQLFAAADTLREKSGIPMTPDEQSYFDEQLRRLREKVNEAQFELIWSKGNMLTLEQAIQFALDDVAEIP